MKNRLFELTGIIANIILTGKYFYDKITIQCEPCINISDCPPCQTDFMKDFWVYMTILNVILLSGIIIKTKKNESNA